MNAGKQSSTQETLAGIERLVFEFAWDVDSLATLYRAICAAACHEERGDINLTRIAGRECLVARSAALNLYRLIAELPVQHKLEQLIEGIEDVRRGTVELNQEDDVLETVARSRSLAMQCDALKTGAEALEVELRKLRTLMDEVRSVSGAVALQGHAATVAGAAAAEAVSVASDAMLRVGAAAARAVSAGSDATA